jgi:hypothetical protein
VVVVDLDNGPVAHRSLLAQSGAGSFDSPHFAHRPPAAAIVLTIIILVPLKSALGRVDMGLSLAELVERFERLRAEG